MQIKNAADYNDMSQSSYSTVIAQISARESFLTAKNRRSVIVASCGASEGSYLKPRL